MSHTISHAISHLLLPSPLSLLSIVDETHSNMKLIIISCSHFLSLSLSLFLSSSLLSLSPSLARSLSITLTHSQIHTQQLGDGEQRQRLPLSLSLSLACALSPHTHAHSLTHKSIHSNLELVSSVNTGVSNLERKSSKGASRHRKRSSSAKDGMYNYVYMYIHVCMLCQGQCV